MTNSTTNSASNQQLELTMSIDELFALHPLPWTHDLLLIRDANGNQVIHTGGLYSERGRLYEGRYLSGLNALLVELVNSRSAGGVVATEGGKSAMFTAYNQAIEDAKAAIRGETVDDPWAAAVFINAIARKCSPHVYVNRLSATASPAAPVVS